MKRFICILMSFLMLFATLTIFMGCDFFSGEEFEETTDTGKSTHKEEYITLPPYDFETKESETTVSTEEEKAKLPFDQANYFEDFNVLYYTSSMYNNFYFDDVTEAGDVIQQALVDRHFLVEDYLGVNVKGFLAGDGADSVHSALLMDIFAGLDTYQLALTHSYLGLTSIVSQNCAKDLYELEYMSFNEDYYHVDAIESLEIGGKAYFGSSDYIISDVCTVFYNKDMYAEAKLTENPYDLVRNGKWTLEKFKQIASNVSKNNGDSIWDKNDIYGLGVRADWEIIPLVNSCDVQWLVGNEYKTLNMGPGNEKYKYLYDWCEEVADAQWSYMYNFGDNENKVTIADGRFLFTMEPVKYSKNYVASDVNFGILPYPKYDEKQTEYYSLDASGMFCVPITVSDDEMVGKVIECLSFYSAETVKLAYYRMLLGVKLSDAPDDAEMLDKYIFDNISLNPAFNYCEKANKPLGILVYTIPKMLRAKLNGTTIADIATNWSENRIAAQKVIDSTINKTT